MKPEIRARIVAFNKQAAAKAEKASDMDVLISALLALAPGQVKKVLSDEAVLTVLRKYGFSE